MMSNHHQLLYGRDDHSSFSNSHDVVVTHVNLNWNIDFNARTLSGCVDHDVKILVDGTHEVHFDSSRIHFTKGEDAVLINRSLPAKFRIEDPHEVLGSRIAVLVPGDLRKKDSTFKISFRYSTDPEASAVQWLPEAATKGRKNPFVFTQCQAIHARSLLPCMDSPAVKTTYTARVTAPKWCTVLMSALSKESKSEGDLNIFHWDQPVPTPIYLIALAGGRLSSKDVSDRVRIWAEPEVIDAAHHEFDETEDFLKVAEEITGCPYQWTRYDVLCMPPSFPYGGTENVCLTFATPTLLAGDKSLADVIAHEIAHSWTGNLVTNHTWDHFWLNEGWTIWLERKILSKYKKNDEVGILSAQIGYKMLEDSIKTMGESIQYTSLVWDLRATDPDAAYSAVPYEKGFLLLNYLESLVGQNHFLNFARFYITSYKGSTATSGQFKDCFQEFFQMLFKAEEIPQNKAILEKIQDLDWKKLFFKSGMPDYVPCFNNSLSAVAEELAKKWIDFAVSNTELVISKSDIEGWSWSQICLFLEAMDNYQNADGSAYLFDVRVLEEMNTAYGLNERNNAEIKLRWHTLCLKSNADWIVPYVTEFITSQGRMKFVRPLYRALRMSNVGGKLAQRVFDAKKDMYHPIARKMLEADLTKIAAALDNAGEEQVKADSESDSGDELFIDEEESDSSNSEEDEQESEYPITLFGDNDGQEMVELQLEHMERNDFENNEDIISSDESSKEQDLSEFLEDSDDDKDPSSSVSIDKLYHMAIHQEQDGELDMFRNGHHDASASPKGESAVGTSYYYSASLAVAGAVTLIAFLFLRNSKR